MKNRWNQATADARAAESDLGLRVYTSNLLGQESDLVLHGGGNTSVKGRQRDIFGDQVEVLYVKGSGWDLRTIEAAGFPAVRLEHLLRLGQLPTLSDTDMMRQLRLGLLDPGAPTPSVEAILHALIPHRYVDHSHADAVVTLSNTPDGEASLRAVFGDEVLILPYIMPGFILARQVAEATRSLDWTKIRGIVLLHHGIFTFADDAKTSYQTMIELVTRAEDYLAQQAPDCLAQGSYQPAREDCLKLSQLRQAAGEVFGGPVLAQLDLSAGATGFAARTDCAELVTGGPLTPDHTIHAKPFGAVYEADPLPGLAAFSATYQQYFASHAGAGHQCLDTMPRYGVWRDRGMVYLAANPKRLTIVSDISQHTLAAMQRGAALGGWASLPGNELFAVEYWELEQAKLKSGGSRPSFEGKVVVVTGAASGIGKACAELFLAQGAAVVSLDISPEVSDHFDQPAALPLQCDITDQGAVAAALETAITRFGGIDVLVSNAGMFPASAALADLTDGVWEKSLDLNLSAPMRLLRACIPYLRHGFDPAVVFIGSKNVPAPGPGAAAYSAAKAGLTQLMRVAALELGSAGIRVNAVHPNAVYDTGLWTDAVLAERAAHYNLSVAEYRSNNVLRTEVYSRDVAQMVLQMSGAGFRCTTGAQVPVDGGNERVI